ncbi:hypothetical protein MKW98_005608, partial [Papaver atlanticum]
CSSTPVRLGPPVECDPGIGDCVIRKGAGRSSGGYVEMSEGGGGGFCDKQARLSIPSLAKTSNAPAMLVEFPQQRNGPLTPCEPRDTIIPQSGGCIQSTKQTDRSITTLVNEVTNWCSIVFRIVADILIRPLEDVPDPPRTLCGREFETDDDGDDHHLDDIHALASLNRKVATIADDEGVDFSNLVPPP